MKRYNPTGALMPCNGFIHELLKGRDLVPKGIGLAQWKKNLARNALEHFSLVDTASLLE
jgi:hypothetical protein